MSFKSKDLSNKIIVVKIGGSTLGEGDSTVPDIISIKKSNFKPVVVHGGGKTITEWAAKQGLLPEFVNGLRRTNKETLDIAIAVLTGLVNSQIVAEFQVLGGNALGVSGLDGGILKAEIENPDLGYVGRIINTNIRPIEQLLEFDLIPVIAPAALHTNPRTSLENSILNINGDAAAGHIAKSLNAQMLIFQTDVPGVMDARKRIIPHMTITQAKDLIESGIAIGGMIPKIEARITAATSIGSGHIIDGRSTGALMDCINGKKVGTKISY